MTDSHQKKKSWMPPLPPSLQGRRHEFEGGRSIHWKVGGVNTVKTLHFGKGGGA